GPEEALMAEADLVLTTSRELHAAAARLTTRVEMMPCGVRCREFEDAKASDMEPPSLFARLVGLVIGFVGTLRNEIDLALPAAAKNGTAAEIRRMRIARRYDWSAQMALMNELMERALTEKR